MPRLRLVVLGMMGRCPFAGQSWLYLNWLRAFHRLGHEVWYVEDDTVWPYDPQRDTVTDDCSYAVAHVARCLKETGLGDRWAFRFAPRAGACWGLLEGALAELYRSADALLNIGGAVDLRDAHAAHFTAIGNDRQEGKDVVFRGETYRWSKHHEWLKFLELPRRTGQGFELAVRVDEEAERRLLRAHDWRLVSPLTFSLDVFGALSRLHPGLARRVHRGQGPERSPAQRVVQ